MTCRMLSCRNVEAETTTKGLQFFEFPEDPHLNDLWTKLCGMVKSVAGKDWICSDHFVESDYYDREISQGLPSRKWKLKKNAFPSINLPDRVLEEEEVDRKLHEITVHEASRDSIEVFVPETDKTKPSYVAPAAPSLKCRACLKEITAKFEQFKWLHVRSLYEECTSLHVTYTEAKWQVICSKCHKMCLKWRCFKRMCLRSDKILRPERSDHNGRRGMAKTGQEDIDPLALGEFHVVGFQSEADFEQEDDQNDMEDEEQTFEDDKELVEQPEKDTPEVGKVNMDNELEPGAEKKEGILDLVESLPGVTVSDEKPDSGNRPNPVSNLPYQCTVCSKHFRHSSALKVHTFVHTGEKPYPCNICERKFSDRSNLRRHVHKQHRTYFPCIDCKKKFKTKAFLKLHTKNHHTLKKTPTPSPLECTKCKRTFATTAERILHLATHLKTEPKPFRCEQCEKGFNKAVELKIHKATYHQTKTDVA